EVIIIVQKQDLERYRDLFLTQVSIENYNKLPAHSQEFAKRLLEIGRYVRFAVQEHQEGFGHAIYCSRELLEDEPFLLMLGDHIYRSDGERSCAQQLLEAFEVHNSSVVGLRQTSEDQIGSFGTVGGSWIEDGKLLNITEFAEKPTVDFARSNLNVPGIRKGDYLTLFGQYVVKPQLFQYLEEHIENNLREKGEFQLTSALDRLRQEDGFLGLVVDGQRFDIGLPEYYLATLDKFSK
ncbi:MAG: sugar phosphate nucleotidyltransferase, partial [bacterium]